MKMFSLPGALEKVDVTDKWNFIAGCIQQVQCGYDCVYGLEFLVRRKHEDARSWHIVSCPSDGC